MVEAVDSGNPLLSTELAKALYVNLTCSWTVFEHFVIYFTESLKEHGYLGQFFSLIITYWIYFFKYCWGLAITFLMWVFPNEIQVERTQEEMFQIAEYVWHSCQHDDIKDPEIFSHRLAQEMNLILPPQSRIKPRKFTNIRTSVYDEIPCAVTNFIRYL